MPTTCPLCSARRCAKGLALCRRCAESTSLHRIVTVPQLAALTQGLEEDRIWWYLKRREENRLTQAGAAYAPRQTRSVFIHIDRLEQWSGGQLTRQLQ
jgi:hypothetical protein